MRRVGSWWKAPFGLFHPTVNNMFALTAEADLVAKLLF